MKKRSLCLILAMTFSWTPLFAKFEDEYLDALLADAEGTLYTQRESAKNYKEDTGFEFNPEHLNLVGALAKRQYEQEIFFHPISSKDLSSFLPEGGGYVERKDLEKAHRFEGISKNVHQRLRDIYDNKILEKPVRVINNVGGIYATMEIYNCSAKEYLALFGTLMKQSGYSGRYAYMNVWDVMVDGEMVSHGIKTTTTLPITYGPADVSLLKKKERRLYKTSPGALMIDYGRGFIIPAFWQGVIIPFKNNGDFESMKDQFVECAKSFFTS